MKWKTKRKKSRKDSKYSKGSRKDGYKSGLEREFAELLFKNGVKAEYEPNRFKFVRMAHYTPDWRINPKLYIETKGYFSPRNRGDLLSFREQYPSVEIVLVFQAPNNRLNARSKTTYTEWAESHGFRSLGIKDTADIIKLFKQGKQQ